MKIGQQIRMRRKKLRLSQQQLAENDWTRSYISQVEGELIQPSVGTLFKLAEKLDTTASELVGDGQLLRKAKMTVFYPQICLDCLALLPKTSTTIFLAELTNSLLTRKTLDCQLPPNAELYYLNARVLIFQQNYQQAKKVLVDGLRFVDEFWRILFLLQLCNVTQRLSDPEHLLMKEKFDSIMQEFENIHELQDKIAEEIRCETDSTRSTDLINLLSALNYFTDLQLLLR